MHVTNVQSHQSLGNFSLCTSINNEQTYTDAIKMHKAQALEDLSMVDTAGWRGSLSFKPSLPEQHPYN